MKYARNCIAAVLLLLPVLIYAAENEFLEEYAFGNAEKALSMLTPGTKDYYFYNCLYAFKQGNMNKYSALLAEYREKFRNDTGVTILENRELLSRYSREAKGVLRELVRRLNLRFDHAKQGIQGGREADYPASLNERLIHTDHLFIKYRKHILRYLSEEGYRLLFEKGTDREKRNLILDGKITDPRVKGILETITAILKDTRRKYTFDRLRIAGNLFKEQLDQLNAMMPSIREDEAFVQEYMKRLRCEEHPTDEEKDAELERQREFSLKLSSKFNSLKVRLCYEKLDRNLEKGVYNKDLFMEYLAYPRISPVTPRKYIEKVKYAHRAKLGIKTQKYTGLGRVSSDTDLIRTHLEHFFKTEDSYQPYLPYLDKDYLKETFAASKILAGSTDPEYFNMLSPGRRKELAERVEITILRTTPKRFKRSENAVLNVAFKNVEKAYIKIYRINAVSFMRKRGGEPTASFSVNGIKPNIEKSLSFKKPATARFEEKLAFPEISSPGYYLVDIIGNGVYARAMIVKGSFNLLDSVTEEGVRLTVLDEEKKPVEGAALFIEKHVYTTDAAGSVTVPFSNKASTQKVVITKDRAASIASFRHVEASYRLNAAFYLEKESVIPGNLARVLISPRLTRTGRDIPLSLLKNVQVRLRVRTRDGIETSHVTGDVKLKQGEDYVAEFRVPDYIKSVYAVIEGEVSDPWDEKPKKLHAGREFMISTHEPVRVMDVYLTGENGKYVMYILGKNGETIPRFDIECTFTNRYFRRGETLTLQSDLQGRIRLGTLKDITGITVRNRRFNLHRAFSLNLPGPYLPPRIAAGGDVIEIPFQVNTDFTVQREEAETYTLSRLVRGVPVKDCTSRVSVKDGALILAGLAPGTYRLGSSRRTVDTLIQVREEMDENGLSVEEKTAVKAETPSRLRIASVSEQGDEVRITLTNSSGSTRVHVIGTFFTPQTSLFYSIRGMLTHPVTDYIFGTRENIYRSGQKLDPEYMYILSRQDTEPYVGNLLKRPGLILNRIETQEVFTEAEGVGAAGKGAYGWRGGGGKKRAEGRYGGSAATESSYTWFDFLMEPAAVIYNLKPDAAGRITVKKEDLGNCRYISVCAMDSSTAVPALYEMKRSTPLKAIDLRLANSLDPSKLLGQRSSCRPFTQGQTLVIRNRASSDFVVFRTAGELYRYCTALHNNALLREFEFVTTWHSMTAQEKLDKYSEYACHELNFFIYKKDREFFDKVIKPYTEYKLHTTFLDDYLLKKNLSRFRREENYANLNLFEQILFSRGTKGFVPEFVNDRFEPDPAAEERAIETALGVFGISPREQALAGRRKMDRAAPQASAKLARSRMEHKKKYIEELRDERKALADADDKVESLAAFANAEKARAYFKNVGKTREYMENNYYGKTPQETTPGMIAANKFWYDYASQNGGSFLSPNIGTIGLTFTDMMLVLALTDLPFEKPEHDVDMKGTEAKIGFKGNALVFMKEIVEMKKKDEKILPLMVKSRYFYNRDLKKREELRKPVRREFLPSTIYCHDITVVNPTDRTRKCDLFIQIPQGSVAFNVKGDIVRRKVKLGPYRVTNERIFFYFPETGTFSQYPAQVYDIEGIIASGGPMKFAVKDELTEFDEESWEYVAAAGNHAKIIGFLEKSDLKDIQLDRIYYLCRNKRFHSKLMDFMISRHAYDRVIFSYGLMHNHAPAVRCFLEHTSYKNNVGWHFNSPVLSVNAVEDKWYQLLEYDPLVIPRAHTFNGKSGLKAPRIRGQYRNLLDKASHKRNITDNDRLQYIYYLLLYSRIGEAIKMFEQIDRSHVTPAMQYDYMLCYISFFKEDLAAAEKTARKYKDYPVVKWQKLFREVLTQIAEARGQSPRKEAESREAKLAALTMHEVALELEKKGGTVRVQGRNTDKLAVKIYRIDAETLFSANPFDQGLSERFSYVVPGKTFSVKVNRKGFDTNIRIPKEFSKKDFFIEVSAGGIERSALVFSNDLNTEVYENYGRIKVSSVSVKKPLKKVYVKVYTRTHSGQILFYKDGYTDIRGIFDYATLSSSLIDRAKEYSILVLSEKHGSKIIQVKPPKR